MMPFTEQYEEGYEQGHFEGILDERERILKLINKFESNEKYKWYKRRIEQNGETY